MALRANVTGGTVGSDESTVQTLWQVMVASVEQIYAEPDAMAEALKDGRWFNVCVREVRGF